MTLQKLKQYFISFLCIFWVFITPTAVGAQTPNNAPLIVGFAEFPPYMHINPDGSRSGFIVELAEEIGRELSLEIRYHDSTDAQSFVRAQVEGRSQIVPGIAQLPPLRGTNSFSVSVGEEALRLMTLTSRVEEIERGKVEGLRIGVVPPAVGSDIEELLSKNTVVEFGSPEAAIMHLFIGDVDVILNPNPTAYDLTRQAGMDQNVSFIDPPIRVFERYVAVHESRTDLLPAINAVIEGMKGDGRLAALRAKYFIELPDMVPEVLRVGVFPLEPHIILEPNQEPQGFAIEVLEDLAEIAGLELQYVPISMSGLVPGVTHDLLPIVSINDARREVMDFAYPLEASVFSIFMRDGEAENVRSLEDLADLRVAVVEVSIVNKMVKDAGLENVKFYDQDGNKIELMIRDLEAGNVDAVLFERKNTLSVLERLSLQDQVIEVEPPFFRSERAIALRPGLGIVRERLNAVLPSYLISSDFQTLRQKYFGEPIFWTPQRVYAVLTVAALTTLALLLSLFLQRQKQRRLLIERQRADIEREKAHSEELGNVIEELKKSNRDLDEFAYIASHDLKEPLRGIGINTNFLMNEELPPAVKKRVTRLGELSSRMENLISDLLFFSRLSHGDKKRSDVNVKTAIDNVVSDLAEWLAEKNGKVVVIGEFPTLVAEVQNVKTVLQNLIVNGVKYNDSKEPRVEIGFQKEAIIRDEIFKDVIYVKDNGIGIDERHREKVFRIFSRLNKRSDYDDTGSGSGLSFVRRIVEEYGGKVDFVSKPNQGATFFVQFPVKPPH